MKKESGIALFIRALKNQVEAHEREPLGKLSALVSSLCNLLLCGAKISVGLLAANSALVADGFNNLSDLISQVVTLVSFKISSKPADKNHPYGHARAEYLATTLVAMLILFMGSQLLRDALGRWGSADLPDSGALSLLVIILSILIKFWMYWFNNRLGIKINSELLRATAKDSLNDVLATSAVLLSTLIAMLWKFSIDPYVAALVALFVLKTGFQILMDMLNQLLGKRPDPELFKAVVRSVNSYEGILSTHDLLIHEYGPMNLYASIHVKMDAASKLLDIHQVIDRIERDVARDYGLKLLIHVDPQAALSEEEKRIHSDFKSLLKELNPELRSHDFQIHRAEERQAYILSVDVVLPDSYKEDSRVLESQIRERMQERVPKLELTIDFDRAYQRMRR